MERVTASSGSAIDVGQFEDHEPYKGTLKKIDFTTGSAEYGSEQRLTLDWELENGDNVRDWISLRLGKQQNGTVSKLRQLLNALSEKPADTQVEWFDPDSLEWSYEKNGAAFNKLAVGAVVIFRGKRGVKADGSAKFTVNVYQMPKKAAAAAAGNGSAKAKLKPAGNDEAIPF